MFEVHGGILLVTLGVFALAMAGPLLVLRAGLRAGDHPGDAWVSARLTTVDHPEGALPVVRARVVNPGRVPVVVGLSLRASRLPRRLHGGRNVRVPRWTTRKNLRAEQYTVLGVVDAGAVAEWTLPIAGPGRSLCLRTVLGQGGGRLRVVERPVSRELPVSVAEPTR